LAISFAVTCPTEDNRSKYLSSLSGALRTPIRRKNDAAAVAANFTEDGVLVTPDGTVFGREAIEKYYADLFQKQKVQLSNNLAPIDEDSPHIIGTAGNEMWATGKWSCTVKGQNFGPVEAKGYWSVIREGDDWNIRMLTWNVSPAPPATGAATRSPTTTPSSQ
jgi:uncharacterized protein (TIGR02246 family)